MDLRDVLISEAWSVIWTIIMKREVAESICGMVDDVFKKLHDFNSYVNENCDSVQIDKIGDAVASCVLELDLQILEPIYKAFPDLKPPFLP